MSILLFLLLRGRETMEWCNAHLIPHFEECWPWVCTFGTIQIISCLTVAGLLLLPQGSLHNVAWLIRCPLDASDDYLKTLVATGSCWSFACRMDRKLESNYIEVCVCSKLLGPKWPVLIHWFETAVTNNNPFKNSHYEVSVLVSWPHKL